MEIVSSAIFGRLLEPLGALGAGIGMSLVAQRGFYWVRVVLRVQAAVPVIVAQDRSNIFSGFPEGDEINKKNWV